MKGISALIFCLLITGALAQSRPESVNSESNCNGNCWERCVNNYLIWGNQAMKDVATYLLFLRSARSWQPAQGTAFAYDLTRDQSWKDILQRNLAASATLILPSANKCNPFFYSGYMQGYYTGWTTSAPLQWQCDETCDAATDILNIPEVFPEAPPPFHPDQLTMSCTQLKYYSMADPSWHPAITCVNPKQITPKMLLSFYNSNDQVDGPDCNDFWPRIETIVGCPTCATGWNKKHFSQDHYSAARNMRRCLMKTCCPRYPNPTLFQKSLSQTKKYQWGVLLKDGTRAETKEQMTFRELVRQYPGKAKVDFDSVDDKDVNEMNRLNAAADEEYKEFNKLVAKEFNKLVAYP